MSRLASFEAFINASNGYTTSKVWDMSTRVERTGEDSWRLGTLEFSTPGNDRNRVLAAWYALYLRRCARRDVEPGPFTTAVDDDDSQDWGHEPERPAPH